MKNFAKDISHIEILNRFNRSSSPITGGQFSLSQRERAGVRENRSNENVMWFSGSDGLWNRFKNVKHLIYKALLFVLWLALVTGCQRDTALVPTEIHYGAETCAECGMIINDPHYAAALAWHDPSDGSIQTATFDDIGCLLAWRHHHAGAKIAAVWVKNIHTGAWLDATSALYVKSPRLQTPMGGGIAAGATANDFAALPVQKPVLAWTNLLTVPEDSADSASPGDPGKN